MQHDAHHLARMANKHVSSIPSLPLNKDCKPCLMFISVDCCRRSLNTHGLTGGRPFPSLARCFAGQDLFSWTVWEFCGGFKCVVFLWEDPVITRCCWCKFDSVSQFSIVPDIYCLVSKLFYLHTCLRYKYILTIYLYILFDSPRFRPRLPLQLLRLFQRWMLWVVEQSWETWPNLNMVLVVVPYHWSWSERMFLFTRTQ